MKKKEKKYSPLIPVGYNTNEDGIHFFIKTKLGLTFKASYIFEEHILLVSSDVFHFKYTKEQFNHILKQLENYGYNTIWKERL